MITQKVVEQTLFATEELSNKRRYIEGRTGSLVSTLASKIQGAFIIESYAPESDIDLNRATEVLVAMNTTKVNPPLGEIEDELYRLITSALYNENSLIRDTISPAIDNFKSDMDEYLSKVRLSAPEDDLSVKEQDIPDPLMEDEDIVNLEYYKNITPKTKAIPPLGIDMSVDEIFKLIQDRYISSREEVANWLLRMGSEWVDVEFHAAFSRGKLETLGETAFSRLDRALFLFMAAESIIENVPEMEAEVGLDELRNILASVQDLYGAQIVEEYKTVRNYQNLGRILVSKSSDGKSLYVYKPTYRKWLESEGSIEVLLGYIVSGDTGNSTAFLNKNIEKYSRKWSSYRSIFIGRHQDEKMTAFRSVLGHIGRQHLDKLSDVEDSVKDAIIESIDEYAEKATFSDMEDLWTVSIDIVAGLFYANTNAYRYIQYKKAIEGVNPSIEPHESNLLVSLEIVSDWISEQVYVVSDG